MVDATLFDFTGVIADDEAGHFREYTTIHNPTLFPGVVEFVNRAGSQYL
jgi:beta-phosphoglucomutase-like phosphatase (HAD superfamily)